MDRPHSQRRRQWAVLTVMTGASSMIAIDALVVLVALPSIQRGLDSSATGVQWIVTAYLLGFAGAGAIGGRAGDVFGHTRAFHFGTILFVVASVAAGLAQSEPWLIIARTVQGMGGAILRPACYAIMVEEFGQKQRGRALGFSASASTAFYSLAPLIGGVLTTAFSWRAIFFINPPLGIAAVILTRRLVTSAPRRSERVDWVSAPLLFAGLVCVVLALMQARFWGWFSPAVLSLLPAGAALLVLLFVRERRRQDPVLRFELFRLREFSVGTGVVSAARFAFIGFSVFGVIWLQDVLGMTALEASLWILPLTLPTVLCAPLGGWLYDRVGPRVPLGIGMALCTTALLWAASVLHEQNMAWLVPSYCALGTGIALAVAPAWTTGLNGVPNEVRAASAGVIQTCREVSAALGVTVLGTVVAQQQSARLRQALDGYARIPASQYDRVERSIGKAVAASEQGTAAPAGIPTELLPALKHATTAAVSAAYYVAAGVLFLAAAAVPLLPRRAKSEGKESGRNTSD
ncbi:MFS transporter [Streptomyces sp. NPDC047108]|uniref:MFS transporter n=1 Tax=Streptomyces sp. NPDC047108 TaxID=3155025 RepID=UPI00340549CF